MSPRRKHQNYARLWIPPLANLVLAAFMQHACQMLAALGVNGLWLQIDALYLVFPLLYLRFAHGLPQVVFTALALDAFWPGPYGTRLVLYAVMLVVMLPFRVRIRRENPIHVFWLALSLNLLLFGGLWCVAVFGPAHIAIVSTSRILGDLIISEIVVGFAAFWWMELQRKIITIVAREDPASYTII